MCGIVGYLGEEAGKNALKALRCLDYRGYDSAGIAIIKQGALKVFKTLGEVSLLKAEEGGSLAIAHTRWATHGAVSLANTHPHVDCKEKVAIVHNGIIENWDVLKAQLKGHHFVSQTDSEVIAHLIEEFLLKGANPYEAFKKAVALLKGSYAILCIIEGFKGIFFAKNKTPLILASSPHAYALSSDCASLGGMSVFPLEDGMWGWVDKRFNVFAGDKEIKPQFKELNGENREEGLGSWPHYMLKEIEEQKHICSQLPEAKLPNFKSFKVVGAGSSYHASLYLSSLLNLNGILAFPSLASEYALSPPAECVIAFSQSGETADILEALSREKAHKIGITNALYSSLTRMCDEVIFMNAGWERAVAATKTFLAQLILSSKLAGVYEESLQEQISRALKVDVSKATDLIKDKSHVFYIGRGLCYPIALEGALKLKEIAYIAAEGYAGGELKHGPLSLVEEGKVVVAILSSQSPYYAKMVSNIKEAVARGGEVVAVSDAPLPFASINLTLPKTRWELFPILATIPLQRLAYEVAVKRGLNPDKPRNLAKSVTVE